MRVPELLTVAFTAAALAGCATRMAHEEPPQFGATAAIPATAPLCGVNHTNTQSCVIELTVSDPSNPLDTKGCDIKLSTDDNDLLTLNRMAGNYVYWRIVNSPDYIFTRDGIAFIDNFRPRMFDEGERIDSTSANPNDKKGYQWRVVDGKRRVNGYVINVRKAAPSPRRCELDPWVPSK